MTWAHVEAGAAEVALTHAKGSYQRALIEGNESLSGSTLKGKARKYVGRYAGSRDALLARLKSDARLLVSERKGEHGRRELVIELRDRLEKIAQEKLGDLP